MSYFLVKICWVTCSIFFIHSLYAQDGSDYIIHGIVADANTNEPLADVHVRVVGTLNGTVTDKDGAFILNYGTNGNFEVEFTYIGYKKTLLKSSDISFTEGDRLVIRLETEPVKLSDIVVGPGQLSLSGSVVTGLNFTTEEVKKFPTGINDPMRMLQYIPGVNGDFLNLKPGIRGSFSDDMLYVVDGMEIYGSIFHMDRIAGPRVSELSGLVSIINPETIRDFSLHMGGFPASYGNKDGSVLMIRTVTPEEEGLRGNAFLNIAKTGGLLKGKFDRHSFIVSLQRGYFDLVYELAGRDVSDFFPYYFDLFGKYEYRFSSGRLFAQGFHGSDRINVVREPGSRETISRTNYHLNHYWIGAEFFLTPSLLSNTILYTSVLPERTYYDYQIKGQEVSTPGELVWQDYRKTALLYGFKETLVYDLSHRHSVEAGVNVRYTEVDYSTEQVFRAEQGDDFISNTLQIKPEGYDFSSWLSYKTKPFGDVLIAELGMRVDHQTYTVQDKRWQVSPRFALAFHLPYKTTVRASTGIYHQNADIANLPDVDYGNSGNTFRASNSTHYILGVENQFFPRLELKIETYYKRLAPLNMGVYRERGPLGYSDPVFVSRAYAYGLDLFLRKRFDRWFFWVGYSYGLAADEAEEFKIYRPFDRRHSFTINHNVSLGKGWNINTAYIYATARPYTEIHFEEITIDEETTWVSWNDFPNAARGTPFSQLNLNISKASVYKWGRLTWNVQILNAFNERGIRSYGSSLEQNNQGEIVVTDRNQKDMPRLYTFGVMVEF